MIVFEFMELCMFVLESVGKGFGLEFFIFKVKGIEI